MDENFELFPSKELADAFIQGFRAGIEIADCDHSTSEAIQLPTGEWQVYYGYLV